MITNSRVRVIGLTGVGLVSCATALAVAMPATAAPETAEVGSAAEAWFMTPAAASCSAPVGCPPEPAPSEASAYPEGTLHVGVLSGQPAAHSYIDPDLNGLPPGAKPLSGTLTLPVSQDPDAGNAQAETAKLLACVVTEPVTDGVAGGTTDAPEYDCESGQSPAQLSKDAKSFTVDLAPIFEAWSAGEPDHGVALVPAGKQEPGASWQLTFTGKEAKAEPKISATIAYEVTGTAGSMDMPALPAETPPEAGAPDVTELGEELAAPEGTGKAPEAASEAATGKGKAPDVAPEQRAAAGLTNTPWFTYPGVVYLPLAIFVVTAVLGRALTRPLIPTMNR